MQSSLHSVDKYIPVNPFEMENQLVVVVVMNLRLSPDFVPHEHEPRLAEPVVQTLRDVV